jgi:hypothetical protein
VTTQVQLPRGYHLGWEGEYESAIRARRRACHHRAADHSADLHDSVHDVPVFQVGALILANVMWRR